MTSTLILENLTDHGFRTPRSGRRGDITEDYGASQVVSQRNPHIAAQKTTIMKRIGTWNVRSLFVSGKTHNLIREMERLKIDILGISEMRWPHSGKSQVDGYHVYYSGNDTPQHSNGVGIIVSQTINKSVKNIVTISDRVILLQLETKPVACNLIQVYAPTCDAPDEDIELFYSDIKKATDMVKTHEINILMGDFNAKIGKGRREDVVGHFGLGIPNERGDRMVQFCLEENYIASNTYFQHHPRRLYTWTSNANRNVRNQIDYILINKRFRNAINNVKTYPGADVFTDHNLLVANIKLKLKKCIKPKNVHRLNTRKLKDIVVMDQVKNEISEKLGSVPNITSKIDIEHTWNHVRTTMKEVGEKYLKSNPKHREQPWMTDDILQLMDLRRGCKNRDDQRYKEIQREIRSKIRMAKENWFLEQCEEIEALENRHDSFNLHKKVKEVSGNYRHNRPRILMDEHNNILTSTQDKLKEWYKYAENLFNSNRNGDHNFESGDGLDITKSEVEYAISTAKNDKSPGPDGMYAEIIKVLLQDGSLSVLVNLFNNIYQTGIIPKDWLKSTFVTLPKKPGAKYCSDYRTISLMSHALKIFLKIIHNRIYRKCEEMISDCQFGFRNGFGTREALFSVQVLIQRCRDVNVDVFACFLDYEKAFDTVNHDKLVNILKDLALDDRDIRIIANLYWNQVATVRVDRETSDEIAIRKGVRQGCVLSPLLFNLYAEKIFREALDDKTIGVVVGGQVVNNIRYADDTVLLATNIEDLQELITTVTEHSTAMNIKLNIKKTKWLVVSKNPVHADLNLTVGNEVVERVHSYKYLGCQVNDKWDMTSEIKSRIEQARRSFTNMKKVFTNRHLRISLRVRLLRCYVFSILFYGMEAWTLTEAMCRKLEAFEMWTYRRLLKVSWTDRITNVDILQRLKKQKEVLNIIKRRKLEYFGHVMRNDKYRILHTIIQGKIEGKRGPGRRRTSWLKNLRQWYGLSTTSLFRKAADKVKVMQLIVNALGEHDT